MGVQQHNINSAFLKLFEKRGLHMRCSHADRAASLLCIRTACIWTDFNIARGIHIRRRHQARARGARLHAAQFQSSGHKAEDQRPGRPAHSDGAAPPACRRYRVRPWAHADIGHGQARGVACRRAPRGRRCCQSSRDLLARCMARCARAGWRAAPPAQAGHANRAIGPAPRPAWRWVCCWHSGTTSPLGYRWAY